MKDGIYFDMPDDVYHSVGRLSSSGIKDILESPTLFWFNSVFNPMREERKSEAMDDGSMFHSFILEGETGFNEKYVVMPTEIEQMNKNTNTFKAWKASQTKKVIAWKKYFDMKKIVRHLEMDGQLLSTGFLKGGYAEVSIFWTDGQGIERKARIDYLKGSSFIDLKTFLKKKSGSIEKYISQYFYGFKVFVQLLEYRDALIASSKFNESQVFGNKEQIKFFNEEIKGVEDFLPFVVFVNRKLPQYTIKTFAKENCSDLWDLGEKMRRKAESLYLEYMEIYGKNNAWLEQVDTDNLHFMDTDFPQSFGELLNGGFNE